MPNQPFFSGRIIKGSGKGSAQGIPTLNLDLADIPTDVKEGIYAARVMIADKSFDAAVHYGERSVHGLPRSFEAHLLTWNEELSMKDEEYVSIEIVKRLRDVRNFETEEELKKQIERDIDEAKIILKTLRPRDT